MYRTFFDEVMLGDQECILRTVQLSLVPLSVVWLAYEAFYTIMMELNTT